MKKFLSIGAMLGLITLLLVPTIAVSDTASIPAWIKYGVLKLGSNDPNGDGTTTDAVDGSLQLHTGSGTFVTVTADEISALATATDKAILYGDGSIWTKDATNFSWDDAANANVLKLGAGTGGGTLALLEGSGGGTNTVSVTAPATLAANIEYTLPNALPTTNGNFFAVSTTGAITQAPAQKLIYSATAASAAHAGTTDAETSILPASAEGTATTDIGAAALQAGAVFPFDITVAATGDADGDETLTVNVYFGSEQVGTSGAIAIDLATRIFLQGTVKLRTAGAAGTGYTSYLAYAADNTSGAGTALLLSTGDSQAFSSFDTTATQAFDIKLDWGGTTDAADTATVEDANLFVCNFD